MRKLIAENDLAISRINNHKSGLWIPTFEMREVLQAVGDNAYVLYSLYRTFPFREYSELKDEQVAETLGWSVRKVLRYRLNLIEADLFLVVPYGSRNDRIYKVFVGADVVALHNAGLPSKVVEGSAFNKLKRKFSIETPNELVTNINLIIQEYANNPENYA